jgi:hypothetical protein
VIVHFYAILPFGHPDSRSDWPVLNAMIAQVGWTVVAPGFLANPEVRRWLNGVEPGWTMLEYNSFNSLRNEPSAGNRTIRLEPNLTTADLSGSAVTQ